MTGQAGAGKSRLAYELLRHMPVAFFGFFLNYNVSTAQIDEFEPFTDTLVIIDYIKGNEKTVAAAIVHLIDKFRLSAYKLRILLLERDNLLISGSWHEELLRSIDVLHRGEFIEGEYNIDMATRKHRFLYLDDLDLDPDAVLELIDNICSQKGLPHDTYRDKTLMQISLSS